MSMFDVPAPIQRDAQGRVIIEQGPPHESEMPSLRWVRRLAGWCAAGLLLQLPIAAIWLGGAMLFFVTPNQLGPALQGLRTTVILWLLLCSAVAWLSHLVVLSAHTARRPQVLMLEGRTPLASMKLTHFWWAEWFWCLAWAGVFWWLVDSGRLAGVHAREALWTAGGLALFGLAQLAYWVVEPKYGTEVVGPDGWVHGRLTPEPAPQAQAVPAAARQEAAPAAATGADQPGDELPSPVQPRPARLKFADLHGMQAVKDRLLEPARAIVKPRWNTDAEPPRNGILLHGEPGNGKTVFAEALAGELGVPFMELSHSDVASRWLGQSAEMLRAVFAQARDSAPCVLFIDEVDSLLRSRDNIMLHPEDHKTANALLAEIVKLRQHRVVLMAATNYIGMLDPAAVREGRFDYKVEITPPDEPARLGLLREGAARHAPHRVLVEEDVRAIAARWEGFSVSRLVAVTRGLADQGKATGRKVVTVEDWQAVLREVQGRARRLPPGTKGLADLVLHEDTREALTLLAQRLRTALEFESRGGTLPGGVLFHGPSGTGKTVTAKALAKDSGWTFLSVAGPDLLADRERMNKLFAEARDLRPTILFIDEADEVLCDRQANPLPEFVNRLLVLMDGAGGKVHDLLVVAATNHPQQIDPALLRAGRFTEKIEFRPPPAGELPRSIAGWLRQRRVGLEPGLDAFELAEQLAGQSMANVEGVLQYALNRAIPRTPKEQPVVITREDVQRGLAVVAMDPAA